MEISEIMESLEKFDNEYKRDAVDAALARREEITPHLIALLENVLQDPEKYAEDENYFGHVYAFMLLGHFKEASAHDVIADLFSLPEDMVDDLYGTAITQDLPVVLLRTCNGRTDRIKELILNQNANEFCRGSAIEALMYAAVEGIESREDVLAFYKDLFSKDKSDDSAYLPDMLASCVCDLYPEELMDTITEAYDSGLINPDFIEYASFEKALSDGKETCLSGLQEKLNDRQLDNMHASMEWWACFEQPEGNVSQRAFPDFPAAGIPAEKRKPSPEQKLKKAKRKQKKASKKANRKKKKK